MKRERQRRLTAAAASAAATLLLGACGSVSMSPEAMPPAAQCGDGNFGHGPRREGICANHDGVRRWMDGPGRRIRRD